MKNKSRVQAFQREVNARATYHESNFQIVQKLFAYLHRPNPLYDNEGNVKAVVTIRAYWLKYNRDEYRKTLRAIRLHLTRGAQMGQINGHQYREWPAEFKPLFHEKTALTHDLRWALETKKHSIV